MRTFDVVVVGAGPAGLSAAAELVAGGARALLVDGGPPAPVRRRDSPEDILSGVGGAGLFSDGKHSFYPSATALWALPDRDALAAAFAGTAALLREYGVEAGALPAEVPTAPRDGEWTAKPYPSLYVGFAERLALIERLWHACLDHRHHAQVTAARRVNGSIVVDVEGEQVACGAIVVATGRWSPRWIRSWLEPLGVRFGFRRVELGVRLETSATNPLFARLPGTDGKLVFRDGLSEIRTFCTCRDGEVVSGRAGGLVAVSGRADGPRTGRSNVGLMVRSEDAVLGRAAMAAVSRAQPATWSLADWTGPAVLAPMFGEPMAAAITAARDRLVAWEPALAAEPVTVHAPCIEGVGDYPLDDGSLAAAPGVWLAGDVQGRFRGIVASMISGRYVATQMLRAAP